MADKES